MPSILDYYEFAKLSTAAYIKLEDEPSMAGAKIAIQANRQERIPEALANQMFDPKDNPNPVWTIANKNAYHGNDETGFAATLFERDGEKVLAIRGTEPSEQWGLDLFKADIGQIGMVGLALEQTISMINFIAQLRGEAGTKNVNRLELVIDDTPPPSGNYVTMQGLVSDKYAWIKVHENDIDGYGLIGDNEQIKVTGHSLGGHLATMAARLFPDLITEAYTFNAPGFDPETANVARILLPPPFNMLVEGQKLTDEFIDLFSEFIPGTPAAGFSDITNYNLESEDIEEGNDSSLVASILTGAGGLGEETFIPTEGNSHLIEPFMDSLSMQALLCSIDKSLTIDDMENLYLVASDSVAETEETLLKALYNLFKNEEITLNTIDITDGFDVWLGIGDIEDRRNYYSKLLEVEQEIGENQYTLEILGSTDFENTFTPFSASQIKDLAIGNIAYRYALVNLNPFAILGADYSSLTKMAN